MNKLDKFILKLDKKTRKIIKEVLDLIIVGDFSILNVKKLSGSMNRYRVRVGRIRIIFEYTKNGTKLQDISFRDDNTYN